MNEMVLSRTRVASFLWQHLLLLASLYILTLGVALCVRSNLGSSVISSVPLAFTIAGDEGFVPRLSLGDYTNIINALFVVGQIFILRRMFEPVQLLQLAVGIVFGWLIDMNMLITESLHSDTLPMQIILQLTGCTLMGIGVALEVKCGSITMPGEGLPVAIGRRTGIPFAKVKIAMDSTLVVLAALSCFIFWREWRWNVVGIGTMIAMVYVGYVVKILSRHLGWFDRLLSYQPGFRRYIYGLARFIYRH